MFPGVDELAGCGVLKGAGPAAQAIAGFEQRDVEAARRQCRRRRQARQAAADDEDAGFIVCHGAAFSDAVGS